LYRWYDIAVKIYVKLELCKCRSITFDLHTFHEVSSEQNEAGGNNNNNKSKEIKRIDKHKYKHKCINL
jgi:hypothetical protein